VEGVAVDGPVEVAAGVGVGDGVGVLAVGDGAVEDGLREGGGADEGEREVVASRCGS
jgi:hypothetical protein